VPEVLKEQNERMEQRFRLRDQGYDIEKVIERVPELFSLSKQDIVRPSRQRQRVMARSVLCYWAIREPGMSGSEVSKILKPDQSSVSRAVGRGERLANDRNRSLIEV
jgi:chromosomal replication initiation ATPase DnaA